MPKIGSRQISEAFTLGTQVAKGEISEKTAIDALIAETGMNGHSASGYIYGIQKMLAGELYTRTINIEATTYFLKNILSEFGLGKAKLAVQAVEKHLTYYPGGGQPGITSMLADFSHIVSRNDPFEVNAFDQTVDNLMHGPESALAAQLPTIGHKPLKVRASVSAFVRNPAVAAYVRRRAKGMCERCNQPAPFLKKSSALPYLEVHHVIRLADEGDDTVENAIAVCPNCHRFLHFG